MKMGSREFPPRFRVLITGASGFVGHWLRESLLRALPYDATLICASKLGRSDRTAGADPRENWISLDLQDDGSTVRELKKWAPNVIFHLAAISNVEEASQTPILTYKVNVEGTLRLATSVQMYCPSAMFINIGSSEVYGGSFAGRTSPLAEDALLDPANVYAASKAAADLLIGQMAKRGLRAIRFRPFNHTGPGQVNKFVVPEFAAQIAAIEKGIVPPVIKVGNLETKRDFTDVRDIVSAYVLAASNCGEGIPSGIIMNLSSGTPRRIGDILYALLDLATVNIEIVEDPVRMRASDVPYAAGDSSLAGQVLDWRPKIEWAYTLQSVLDDWRMRI